MYMKHDRSSNECTLTWTSDVSLEMISPDLCASKKATSWRRMEWNKFCLIFSATRSPASCNDVMLRNLIIINIAQTRTVTLTDAGEAVDVGERHGTLGEVQLDHLECRLLDLGEEAFDGLCSGGGLTASRNHVHNVAEKLRNLQGNICMVEYRVP